MKRRRDWDYWLLNGTVAALVALLAFCAVYIVHAAVTHDDSPGPEWTHDRGSIYWSCTDSGRALIRDTRAGTACLDRGDRQCSPGR